MILNIIHLWLGLIWHSDDFSESVFETFNFEKISNVQKTCKIISHAKSYTDMALDNSTQSEKVGSIRESILGCM